MGSVDKQDMVLSRLEKTFCIHIPHGTQKITLILTHATIYISTLRLSVVKEHIFKNDGFFILEGRNVWKKLPALKYLFVDTLVDIAGRTAILLPLSLCASSFREAETRLGTQTANTKRSWLDHCSRSHRRKTSPWLGMLGSTVFVENKILFSRVCHLTS